MLMALLYYTNTFLFSVGFFHPTKEQVETAVKGVNGAPREVSKAQMQGPSRAGV